VPMLLAGRTPDYVAGPDCCFGFAPTLRPAASGGDDQRLPERMGMPRRACAGFESNTDPERAGRSGASNRGSMRAVPVKYSAGPLPEGCEPLRLISIVSSFDCWQSLRLPLIKNLRARVLMRLYAGIRMNL
jgi:hypothetical protein